MGGRSSSSIQPCKASAFFRGAGLGSANSSRIRCRSIAKLALAAWLSPCSACRRMLTCSAGNRWALAGMAAWPPAVQCSSSAMSSPQMAGMLPRPRSAAKATGSHSLTPITPGSSARSRSSVATVSALPVRLGTL